MAMDKIAKTNLDVTAYYRDLKKLDVEFYNQDIETSKLQFQITRNKKPMLLSDINVNAQIILVTSNGSKKVDNLTFEDEMNGVLSYTLPNDVLTHVGDVTGEVFINRKGSDDTIVVRTFKFSIKDALVNTISADTKLSYIRKFDDLEVLIKERVEEIQESIKNLEDYVTKVDNVKEDALQVIGISKDEVEMIIENGKSEIEGLLTNDTFLKVTDFEQYKKNIDKQMKEFKDSLDEKTNDKVKIEDFEATNWQKYKLTNDDGTIQYISKGIIENVLDLEPGLYETVSNDNAESQGIPVNNTYVQIKVMTSERNNKRKEIELTSTFNGTKYYRLIHTDGAKDTGWKEIGVTNTDTGWIPFNLINGAKTNTSYQTGPDYGFECATRITEYGGLTTKYLRLNGSNLTHGQVIAQLPNNFTKYTQVFYLKTDLVHGPLMVRIVPSGDVNIYFPKATIDQVTPVHDVYGQVSWTE
ncbi:MAG: BppU family phage baseplate upper protein [Staphylococcus pseudoxylosus]|uniref:BppU family phage baseplate upper protein n=1 Tax=Staphylococcus pseudoxylosus TaxID=2282419 RepID=UPI0031F678F7